VADAPTLRSESGNSALECRRSVDDVIGPPVAQPRGPSYPPYRCERFRLIPSWSTLPMGKCSHPGTQQWGREPTTFENTIVGGTVTDLNFWPTTKSTEASIRPSWTMVAPGIHFATSWASGRPLGP
jgi:hypothetical protein